MGFSRGDGETVHQMHIEVNNNVHHMQKNVKLLSPGILVESLKPLPVVLVGPCSIISLLFRLR